VDALDASIPVPKRPLDAPFMMPIEAVFNISGRGTVVTGKVSKVCAALGGWTVAPSAAYQASDPLVPCLFGRDWLHCGGGGGCV